jgi:tRNA U38,U39,U40 pseudouridine synthase TruA
LNEKDYKFFRKKDISKDDLNNTIATLKICPYDGCDGDIEGDGFGWETIREHHPEYPVVPVEGIEYPL